MGLVGWTQAHRECHLDITHIAASFPSHTPFTAVIYLFYISLPNPFLLAVVPQKSLQICNSSRHYEFKEAHCKFFCHNLLSTNSRIPQGKTITLLFVVKVYMHCTYPAANILLCSASCSFFLRSSKWLMQSIYNWNNCSWSFRNLLILQRWKNPSQKSGQHFFLKHLWDLNKFLAFRQKYKIYACCLGLKSKYWSAEWSTCIFNSSVCMPSTTSLWLNETLAFRDFFFINYISYTSYLLAFSVLSVWKCVLWSWCSLRVCTGSFPRLCRV